MITTPPTASPVAAGPVIRIDQRWTATDGVWTFTGGIDPNGRPTRVVLEIGPGPAEAATFEREVAVGEALDVPMPLRVETRLPDLPEVCVRFSATNEAGTSSTEPLCVGTRRPLAP